VSTPVAADRGTFRSFALGNDDGPRLLTEPIAGSDVVRSLGAVAAATRRAVAAQLASSVADLLDFDLAGVLVAGWSRYDALVDAARRTAADPSTEEVVELATHRITSVHRPTVDLLFDGLRVGTLHLEATFDCALEGVVGRVARGRLVALHYGRATATAAVSADGTPIIRKEGVLDLDLRTSLGAGILLAPGEPSRADAPTIVLHDPSPAADRPPAMREDNEGDG
jgi:hypothetical protein